MGGVHHLINDGDPRLLLGLVREPLVDAGDQRRIALLQVLVRDAQRARQQAEGELQRMERAEVALGLLEPRQAHLRRALQRLDAGAMRGLVGGERRRNGGLALERAGERDRALHRQLGPGANREVRGVHGVAGKDDVVPVPAIAAHRRKLSPVRAVLQQVVAGELRGEQALAVGDGRVLVGLGEAGAMEGLLGALDDEGRLIGRVAVGVDAKQARVRLLEIEGEGAEGKGGAEPDEAVRPRLDLWRDLGGERAADQRVDPVGADDDVVFARQALEIRVADLGEKRSSTPSERARAVRRSSSSRRDMPAKPWPREVMTSPR